MRITCMLIVLTAVVALILYTSHRSVKSVPRDIIAICQDSYPPVVSNGEPAAEGDARVTVSCKPDRFIRRHVPEHSL